MNIQGFRGEIRLNELLGKHTSFAIGGPADVLAFPVDTHDLVVLLRETRRQGLPYYLIGGGTNLLVRDGGFRGVVISLQHMQAVAIEREYRSIGGVFVAVSADAGAPLPKLVSFASDQGLTGIEFAAGIPGTLGGAVCMNAGTAEGEMGDIIDTVTLLTQDGETVTRGREEMGFGYRTSSIPEGQIVLAAKVNLRRGDREAVQAKVKELLAARKQKQPLGMPNAGSMFKNPLEKSAGRLIETARLKGKTIGSAQVSDKHANFIVNRGNAKAADVLALMDLVRDTVLEVHKVRLEPEIKIIGED